jgi:DnaJ family protein C protein 7
VDVHKRAKVLKQKKIEKNAAFKVRRFSAAYNLYTEARKIDPNNKSTNAKLFFKKIKVCSKLSHLIEDASDFSSALDLERNCLKALLLRAKCYMELRDFDEAVRNYETAFKIDRNQVRRRLLKKVKLTLSKSRHKNYYRI